MLASTLALAMGLVFLAAAHFSGNPTAFGLVVFVGIVFVAMSCAMQLGVVLDRLLGSVAMQWRLATKVVIWLVVSGGTAWLIGRAPSEEVLFALLVVPLGAGIAGQSVARDDKGPAIAFLAVAGLLSALVIWVWLD